LVRETLGKNNVAVFLPLGTILRLFLIRVAEIDCMFGLAGVK
jgi:hypothetical protein